MSILFQVYITGSVISVERKKEEDSFEERVDDIIDEIIKKLRKEKEKDNNISLTEDINVKSVKFDFNEKQKDFIEKKLNKIYKFFR